MSAFWQTVKDAYFQYQRTRSFTCDVCKSEVFFYPQTRLCAACERSLAKNDGNTCAKCGRKTVTAGVCLNCKMKPPAFDTGVSPFVYRGKTSGLVNRIKNGNRRLANYFGERMAELFLARFPSVKEQFPAPVYEVNEETEPLYIVAVPLTKERLRERGYNQAEELACSVAERLRALGVHAETCTDVLRQIRSVGDQKKLGYKERAEHAASVFHLHKRAFCQGKTLVLVDDIMTTGATSDTCARLLKNAGAKTVYFLAAAALPEHEKA